MVSSRQEWLWKASQISIAKGGKRGISIIKIRVERRSKKLKGGREKNEDDHDDNNDDDNG